MDSPIDGALWMRHHFGMDTLNWEASPVASLDESEVAPPRKTHHVMTSAQKRIMEASFERSGPFYLSRDLHAMLDCACVPEEAILSHPGSTGTVDLNVPLGVPFQAKLRQEFFGGILFDRERHIHYTLDQSAYALLSDAAGHRTGAELLERLKSESGESGRTTLEALWAAGLLRPATERHTLQHFAARDLSLEYLQSPTIVEVEVTYGCFRSCRHCAYEASPTARTPDELTAEQWRQVFFKLAHAGTLILQLTGGDPLFREDSFDIVEAAGEAGLSVYVRSDTAALNRANMERLQGVQHLWHVGTSIDGADAEMHDWMRGKGAFAVLRERIAALSESGITVAAGATLHRNNFRSVREIGREAAACGATWFDIGFLSPVGRAVGLRDLVLDEAEIAESLSLYLDGIRAGDYVPSHAHYLRRVDREQPFEDIESLLGKLPYVTEWPFCRLRIDPTGSAYTAGKLKNSEFAGGFNLMDASVEHVWDHSPNLESLRVLGNGGRIHSLDYRELATAHA